MPQAKTEGFYAVHKEPSFLICFAFVVSGLGVLLVLEDENAIAETVT